MHRLTAFFMMALPFIAACGSGGGSSAGEGNFALIEFLEHGKDEVPRNRTLTFRFSGPVLDGQNFFERLKIANTATSGTPDFSLAQGLYVVAGEEVTFVPRLPTRVDRLDAGLRANGNYIVFVKAGPDALVSMTGDRITAQQEFSFETSDVFEDPDPTSPPRVIGAVARDTSAGPNGPTFNIGRIEPVPGNLAQLDNAALIAAGRVIEPGGGAAYQTPWRFEIEISEPVDPSKVTVSSVDLLEIYSDATTSGDTAPPSAAPGYFGLERSVRVPLTVKVDQTVDGDGNTSVRILVTPFFTLVDNTRYRFRVSGSILGIDFRKSFVGDNGLTGDGPTEGGGLGYVTEFIVRDRGPIPGKRILTFNPLEDGINPEKGQTTSNPALFNSSLYNPSNDPGRAIGFLPDFGDGSGGDLAIPSGVSILDTGDTPNAPIGSPFVVQDINADNLHDKTDLSTKAVVYDSREYFTLQLASLVVPNGATLQVIGKNPVLFRVSGLVSISGTVNLRGANGDNGSGGLAKGGLGGAGGGAGGDSKAGAICNPGTSACQNFGAFLNTCTSAKTAGPFAINGEGPGRGQGGGDSFTYVYHELDAGLSGTGGGGGSHGSVGQRGEDRANANDAEGTPGSTCAQTSSVPTTKGAGWTRNSSVIGVRGVPGPTYGDREVIDVNWGGSGGGGGGPVHTYTSWSVTISGGAGGGGGGSIAVYAAGPIQANSGTIDASGGRGGDGALVNVYAPNNPAWLAASGAGGGGSGGSIVLISGANITLAGSTLDTRGGPGGARSDPTPVVSSCSNCNAGGAGGKGYIFLMDADGDIGGLLPGQPGNYDNYALGVLTISPFETSRFSSIAAITELFHVLAPDPAYTALSPGDVQAVVSGGQTIRVFVSSTKTNALNPLLPDLTKEIAAFEVATVGYAGGSAVVTVTGDMSGLNPDGGPARDSFVRVDARFEYLNGVEAALGPFASIDRFDISYVFNN